MTVLSWPTELPRPTRQGYQRGWADARLAKATDAPVPAYRRRYSAVAHPVKLTMVLSRSQKQVFDNFYAQNSGQDPTFFWMPDPVTDGWPMLTGAGAPMLAGDGTPLLLSAQWLCLFGTETPTETLKGMSFTIAFGIWVMP